MNRKYHGTFRKIALVTVGIALASVAILLSWNTLAPLFGGPIFQFRHALALLVALVALRVSLGASLRHRKHEIDQEIRS
jgi:hypothetical protein